jgi:hypothetical protein
MKKFYNGPIRPLERVEHGMVVEPLEGHSDEEALALLNEFGIAAEVLAPGFINSSVKREELDTMGIERKLELDTKLQAIAKISPKRKSEPIGTSLIDGELVHSRVIR